MVPNVHSPRCPSFNEQKVPLGPAEPQHRLRAISVHSCRVLRRTARARALLAIEPVGWLFKAAFAKMISFWRLN